MHENREISGASRLDKGRGRSEKAQSHNADMHVPEKSDRAVVPMNRPNKGEQSSAEVGEGRARTKENIGRSSTSPTQSGKTRVPGIERCAASRQVRFAALSEVRAVCVNALVRICAGGDQQWSSLPRQRGLICLDARNGEYDFSEEKLRDSVGMRLPKLTP
jgi:hypothetical protein